MDNRLELINSLLLLSKQCEHVANLLSSNILNELSPETIISQIDLSQMIDIRQFESWPLATNNISTHWDTISKQQAHDVGLDFSNSKIIEYSNGPSIPIGPAYINTKVDLICNVYKFGSDDPGVKILSSIDETNDQYDIGIIYESLEFDQNPIQTLLKIRQKIKPQGKIFIRFRPWSSRNGGFQSTYINKAYAHLLMDLDSNNLVCNKVVRPLAVYESMLAKAKLPIISRKLRNTIPDDYIVENDEFMKLLMKRTWGTIDKDSAIRIMSTTAVDFLVLV